jgi:hypothetical protein
VADRSARAVWLAAALLAAAAFGQGWVGQGRINRPNADTLDGDPTAAVDGEGCPWVVWITNYGDTTPLWSRWQGTDWAPQQGVSRNAPGVWGRFRPDLAFGSQSRFWLVWCNAYENHNSDIAVCYWDGAQWTPEQQVNQPDSTDLDFAPKVSCGGEQVWCVWYGGPADTTAYSVYASRWNPDIQAWENETQVSPADGLQHWWCDVAVDSLGTPHVVWCTYPLYTVFYSYFDGQQWTTPKPVNDTALVMASPWASPRIVIDRDGVMHVSFTGARVGAVRRDIFYTRNDGSGWIPSQMVTRDSLYDEWYSDIAADSRDNVWIVWDRQNEGPDHFRVYAEHFDGRLWSGEERLDKDDAYNDCGPVVCLGPLGSPWVFWYGTPLAGQANEDVFFNRYVGTGLAEVQTTPVASDARLRCAALQSATDVSVSFDLAASARVTLALYDETGRCKAVLADGHLPKGAHTVRCNSPLAPGVYFCRLQAGGQSVISKVILLGH